MPPPTNAIATMPITAPMTEPLRCVVSRTFAGMDVGAILVRGRQGQYGHAVAKIVAVDVGRFVGVSVTTAAPFLISSLSPG